MSSFLTKLAHNSRISLAPKDTKGLQELIATEKRLIESVTKTASDRNKSSVALRDWGAGEGPDLGDVLAKVAILFQYVATAETQFSEHDATFRLHFKAIRTREESLAMLKRKRDSLASSIESQEKKVGRMKEEHRDLPVAAERLREMRQEMIGTENTVTNEETRLADYKRTTTREALSLKLGAMLQLAEKTVIVAELGKLLCEAIPVESTEPGAPRAYYSGMENTDDIMNEAQRCLQEVVFNPIPLAGAGHDREQSMEGVLRHSDYPTYQSTSPQQQEYASAPLQQYHDGSRVVPLAEDQLPAVPMSNDESEGATLKREDSYASAYEESAIQQNNRSSLAYMAPSPNVKERNVFSRTEEEVPVVEAAVPRVEKVEEVERKRTPPILSSSQSRPISPLSSDTATYPSSPLFDTFRTRNDSPSPTIPPPAPRNDDSTPAIDWGTLPPPVSANRTSLSLSPRPSTEQKPSISIQTNHPSSSFIEHTRSPLPSSLVLAPISPSPPLMSPSGFTTFGSGSAPPPARTAPPTPPPPVLPSPAASPSPSFPTSISVSTMSGSPRKPATARGESALGSKYGDLFVAARGGNEMQQERERERERTTSSGPFQGMGTSGYNSRVGDTSSIGSQEARRVVNAGAFSRRVPATSISMSSSTIGGSGGGGRFTPTIPVMSESDKIKEKFRLETEREARESAESAPERKESGHPLRERPTTSQGGQEEEVGDMYRY